MICPNCHNEIPDGLLLCEKCGAEIQIVPDFDPEIEKSISESLLNMVDDFEENEQSDQNNRNDSEEETDVEKHKSLFVLTIGCIFVFSLIVLVIALSVTSYHKTSGYMQKLADKAYKEKDYQTAVLYYDNALAGQDEDASVIKLKMAECYEKLQDWDNFVNCNLDVIKSTSARHEYVDVAYDRIVKYYDESAQYDKVNSLLQSCEDDHIRVKYSKYMADVPEFNYVEGAYNEVIPLKIIANTNGTIYYTMNGTTPNLNSEEYISPIFLDEGDFEITAIFINEYGIKSPIAKAAYHIEVPVPFAPDVDMYSGDYLTPQLIHIEAEEGCRIFYSTDDTEPTQDSTLYNGFLTMPLGKSTLKFVSVNDSNVSSEVIVRNYNLELLTDYSVADAQTVIYKYLMEQGRIISLDGTISEENPAQMVYTFACCTNIVDEGDFYIFSEYIKNIDGSMSKTGNYYAVGIYNLPLYSTRYDAGTSNFALSSEQLNSGT